MELKHVITASQFNRKFLAALFDLTQEIENRWKEWFRAGKPRGRPYFEEYWLEEIGMCSYFYEPSTRTQASFEIALKTLGGQVLYSTSAAKYFSSAAKGESLDDTIENLRRYGPHVIVLRHPKQGAANRAAEVIGNSPESIINAGDGSGEHPTQALLDLYTLKSKLKKIDGLSIAFMGDVAHSRTIRSLVWLLTNYQNVEIFFCAPQLTQLTEDVRQTLRSKQIKFHEVGTEWKDLISARRVQVIYQTRLQAERFTNPLKLLWAQVVQPRYTITQKVGSDMAKQNILLMHPLPRLREIDPLCDRFETSIYFTQAQNGLFVRMALFAMMFGKHE